MRSIRALIRRNPAAATILLVAALLLKLLVPAGMMLSAPNQVLTVTICADATAKDMVRSIAIPMKQSGSEDQNPGKGACAFSALSMAGLGGADPLLLALALAFVLALGFAPHPIPRARRFVRLRPPLRGPPQAD